jgi:hypothetical protein
MIFVLQCPAGLPPRAWFAFDAADLLRKVAAADLPALRHAHDRMIGCEPLDLAIAALQAIGPCHLYRNEAQAMAAFERSDDPAWHGPGWRARLALREQLVALEVLADDL